MTEFRWRRLLDVGTGHGSPSRYAAQVRARFSLPQWYLAHLQVYDSKKGSNFAKQQWAFGEKIREERTDDGKSIDLVVLAKPLLIGIENKIHAPADYNPYETYSKHLDSKAREQGIPLKNVIKILLSLKVESPDGKCDFEPILYDEFFRRLMGNLAEVYKLSSSFTQPPLLVC